MMLRWRGHSHSSYGRDPNKGVQWGPARRAYYTLIAMMALLVVAFLVRWNYLPPVWR